MATIDEMTEFMAGLSDDALAVLVVQRGRRPFIMRTEELSLGPKLEAEKCPNWVRAVWMGVIDAVSGAPPIVDAEGGPDDGDGSSPSSWG